jgi:hypothetical protein
MGQEIIYENPYPAGSWESKLETLIQLGTNTGRNEILRTPRNLRDLAKIVGKARADKTDDPIKTIDRETLWAFGALMVHHLFWMRGVPFGYCLTREKSSDDYPDITTGMRSFDAIGLLRVDEILMVDEMKLNKAMADYFIFIRGNFFWICERKEVMEWPKMKVEDTEREVRFKLIEELEYERVHGKKMEGKRREEPKQEMQDNTELF